MDDDLINDFYMEDESLSAMLAAWERSRRIWVDFNAVYRRDGGYHVTSLVKFAAVARNVRLDNELTATDTDGTQATARVVSISDEGVVELLLTDWPTTRGAGWCAPSP